MKDALDTGIKDPFDETNSMTFYRERETRDIRRRQCKKKIDPSERTNQAFFRRSVRNITNTFMQSSPLKENPKRELSAPKPTS